MIVLEFFKQKDADGTAKITAHKSGKMGLSMGAAKLLGVADWKYCKFAKDRNAENDNVIYMVRASEKDDASFAVSKAGDYYYVKAKSLLDDLKIDYMDDKTSFIFDVSVVDNGGDKIYKLTKRIVKRRKKLE